MSISTSRCVLLLSLWGLMTLSAPVWGQGSLIGFEERFALADDRAAVLDELVPGSDEAFYYECLLLQHEGAMGEVPAVLKDWEERVDVSARRDEIEHRQALLTHATDPDSSYAYLIEQLGFTFDHHRQVPGTSANLPTVLDPQLVSHEGFRERALRDRSGLDGFHAAGLERLQISGLNNDLLRSLLKRLRRPDVPQLAELVVRDLDYRGSGGFGSLLIHKHLVLSQLERCAQLSPRLLDDQDFVQAWLRRLRPGADSDWEHDDKERAAYLAQLVEFSEGLSSVYNSLKANVLFWQLHHDQHLGQFSRERFLSYLRLPRNDALGPKDWGDRISHSNELVRHHESFATDLPAIRADGDLVEAYLAHFFEAGEHFDLYAEFLREDYVRRVYAESGLLYGLGEPRTFETLLDDSEALAALRDRVEIEFAPTQPMSFGPDDSVAIDVDVKNVQTLLVKIFEIDTIGFYSDQQREVGTDIVLDGLVANEEFTVTYDESPLRRVRRHFELPSLQRPGVYVVEFVGNGLASRAVIHKGRLRLVERVGSAGHVFRVLDEAGQLLADASLWIANHLYTADEQGEVVVPFSSSGGSRVVVVRHGDRATLERFEHRREAYELEAAFFIDREGMLEGQTAQLLMRPSLFINGQPASLELLENAVLSIGSADIHGLTSTLEVRDLDLSSDGEWVQDIVVPADLVSLTAQLSGTVTNLSQGKDDFLASDEAKFELNLIDWTEEVSGALLGRSAEGYVLDLLGKNGEAVAGQAVTLSLSHRGYVDPLVVSLESDGRGRVGLGELPDVFDVRVLGRSHTFDRWELLQDAAILPDHLYGTTDDVLSVPYMGTAQVIDRSVLSLFEMRDYVHAVDRLDHASLVNGYIELRGLPAGHYELYLKEQDHTLTVRVTAGRHDGGGIVGPRWMLPVEREPTLQITDLALTTDELVVSLAGLDSDARVHVIGSRYLPAYDPWLSLAATRSGQASAYSVQRALSSYVAGRQLSDEVRYILERRFAQTFPGNMLRRPSLLLNPWAMEETDSVVGIGGGGGGFGSRGKLGMRGKAAGAAHGPEPGNTRSPNVFSNLAFLPRPSLTLANLRPDDHGVVRVPRSVLGDSQLLSIVAVQGEQTVFRSLNQAEQPLQPRDQRLAQAISFESHLSEQRSITFLDKDGTATIADVSSSEAQVYDSLSAVFQLFKTLGGEAELSRFADLLRWPELDAAERRAFYDEFACHELHLFLHQKDPAYFAEVIRPYLAHKLDQTFLDHWLLNDDLTNYWQPWEFSQLNVVERILLARRSESDAASVTRLLTERLELVPADVERERRYFETALAGSSLGGDEGLAKNLADAVAKLDRGARYPTATAPPPAEMEEVIESAEALGYTGGASSDAPKVVGVGGNGSGSAGLLTGRGRKASADMGRRSSQRSLYSGPDQTREYVEHNYWQRFIEEQDGRLVTVNGFWLDLAATPPGQPFVSTRLTDPVGSVNEMLLALALLDLPLQGEGVTTTVDGGRMELTASGPLLLVRKDLADTPISSEPSPILITQNLFRVGERTAFDGQQMVDLFVTGEFLTGVAYGAQVVLTNPGSSTLALELLTQIPEGALPLRKTQRTFGRDVRLSPHDTSAFESFFYFPAPGTFAHYPAHVSEKGEVVAFAEPRTLEVVTQRTTEDTTSWEYVSQQGSSEQVWDYLAGANLYRIDLTRMAWRLSDPRFFQKAVEALGDRHVFSPTVWSYALRHGDAAAVRDLLANNPPFVARCGPLLDSPLLTIDPVARGFYQHIEYEPLFNARAHRLGASRMIFNDSLAYQYSALMHRLAHQPELGSRDWLEVTYALLLQDRVGEALAAFDRVDPSAVHTDLQLDAVAAYLAFYRSDLAQARAIAEAHREHPVARWRDRFTEILAHLDEAEGLSDPGGSGEAGSAGQTSLVASEPSLDLEVSDGVITLRHQNLKLCEVRYTQRDLELLFSSDPFSTQGASTAAAIRPNRSDVVTLNGSSGTTIVNLPEELARANVLIEVRGAGLVRRAVSEASALAVQLIENYGQLKLTHQLTGRALPGAYIKVYAQLSDDTVVFHKDGYTDLRGRFDYASLSAGHSSAAARYAILVLSDTDGAVVREVAAPLQ